MKKENPNIFQKIFGFAGGINSRVPLRSNIYRGGSQGYSQIGGTGKWNSSQRQSPLLGNAGASNLLSSYYSKVDELHGYQLIDVCKLATNFFADYVINFLEDSGQQVVTVLDEDGNADETKTERINEI